jgi:fluoroacetyl-CoA thioesterase
MREIPAIGLTFVQSITVDEGLIVPAVSRAFTGFQDMPPVFATAFMVGFVEWTCIEALRPYLKPHEHSVGTLIDMSHINPTPVGMVVTAKADLVALNGRMLRFEVSCTDELGEIGRGFHERAIIDQPRFMRRVSDRLAQVRVLRTSNAG